MAPEIPAAEAQQYWVPLGAADIRLDRYLAAAVASSSRARLQAAIRAGQVRVNGRPVARPGQLLHAGDTVAVCLPPPPPSTLTPADIPLEVLFEDDDLAAINKPAGLVVHPGAGSAQPTLVHALLHRYAALSTAGGAARPGIVHRLDRYTSGVLIVARNDEAHRRLAVQFHDREVRKAYFAIAHGRMAAAAGEIDLAIRRDSHHRIRMTTKRRGGREAHSAWRLLEAWEPPASTPPSQRSVSRYSRLEVEIATGRTHQIRVHLAALAHPVVGDRLYGAPAALAGPGELAGWRPERIYLHAGELDVNHPRTGERLQFRAPLPPEFTALVDRLRQACPAYTGSNRPELLPL